jgi:hypothetical protein
MARAAVTAGELVDLFFDDDIDGSTGRAIKRASFGRWINGIQEDSMPAAQLDLREVQVQQVNGHGFKSTDGEWLNISKFARAEDVAMPKAGERVQVSLDRSGFVRKIETIASPAPVTAPVASVPPGISQDDRGTVITREAVLNTAVAILSSGGRVVDPTEVLALAAKLEVWATR